MSDKQNRANIALKFLNALFEEKEDSQKLLLWHPLQKGHGGKSNWFDDIDQAAQFSAQMSEKSLNHNIYVQIGLSNTAYGPYNRCAADEEKNRPIISLPGLFADIDYAHDVHSKKDSLPETIDDAKSLIYGKGFDPTLVVHSGHGLQAYWLFKELWELPTKSDRANAARLLTRLKLFLQKEAARKNWVVDSVQDLARIMRLPGTFNCKDENPIPVKIIEYEEYTRYNPEDLEEIMGMEISSFYVEEALPQHMNPDPSSKLAKVFTPDFSKFPELQGMQSPREIFDMELVTQDDVKNQAPIAPDKDGNLTLELNAIPPLLSFFEMIQVYPKFEQTWTRSRQDIASLSEYDYSLISQMVYSEIFNDQEIANTIIAFRRQHGNMKDFMKAFRKNHIAQEIARCRNSIKNAKANKTRIQAQTISNTPYANLIPKSIQRDSFEAKHGFKIIDIEKFPGDNVRYDIHTNIKTAPGGLIRIRSTKELFSQNLLKHRIIEEANFLMKTVSKKEWVLSEEFMAKVLRTTSHIDESSELKGRMKDYIVDYLTSQTPRSIEEAVTGKKAFIKDGYWNICISTFKAWVKGQQGEKPTDNQFAYEMSALKCKNKPHKVKKTDGKRTTLRSWIIPHAILTDYLELKARNFHLDEEDLPDNVKKFSQPKKIKKIETAKV